MSEENKDIKQEGVDDQPKELTNAELMKITTDQAAMMETLQNSNTSLSQTVQSLTNQVEQTFGESSKQMSDIRELLGVLATGQGTGGDAGTGFELTDLTQDQLNKLMDDRIAAGNKTAEDTKAEANKKHSDDYVNIIQRSLNTRTAPDGKAIDQKTRNDIMTLLKTEITAISSNDGTEAGLDNFEKAYKRVYGMDREHAFKGGDPKGSGSGGGDAISGGSESKTTTKLGSKAIAQLNKAGISEAEGKKLLERNAKRMQESA